MRGAAAQPARQARPIDIRLLHVAGCPLVERVRVLLDACLRDAGFVASVEEIEGPCASPTLVVGGVDVVTGAAPATGPPSCRLDLPTAEQILAVLQRRTQR